MYDSLDHDTRRDPELVRRATLAHQSLVQYARRAIIHEPDLSLKAMDKVSFKDLLLSDDFSMEDAAKLVIMLGKRLELGLLWYKDAVLEAIIMSPSPGQSRNAANIGNPSECRPRPVFPSDFLSWTLMRLLCIRGPLQGSRWLDIYESSLYAPLKRRVVGGYITETASSVIYWYSSTLHSRYCYSL